MHLKKLIKIVQYWGLKQTLRRAYYEVGRKSGWYKHRYPVGNWQIWIPEEIESIIRQIRVGERFFLPRSLKSSNYQETFPDLHPRLLAKTKLLEDAKHLYFSKLWYQSESWFQNPVTKQSVNPGDHWTSLRFSSPLYGDLKIILEPSRFAFAYDLVRVYWLTSNERHSALFWNIFDDWCENNPPQSGPLWVCGQEAAIRVMAWCFALYGFRTSKHTTDERITKLVAVIVAHIDRIEGTLAYARSQKNNHILSEATALWTVGLLLPEMNNAKRWQQAGCRLLTEEVTEQIYNDGSYVQHSTNYHRLMLQLLLWAYRLGEINHHPLPDIILQRIRLALRFLLNITDLTTGKAPNYGANDGALVLPLNDCDYTDFRPVLQSGYYLIHKKRIFSSGPWDEDLLWLFGPQALSAPVEPVIPTNLSAPDGGYYTLRSANGFVFTRCARFRHRPAQADMLHVDLWWRGQNIALDPGSYSYNAPPPWDNALAGTAYHNTITVDGQDQMARAGRFLWLPWLAGQVRFQQHHSAGCTYWEGEHDGYHRLKPPVTHQRAILSLPDESWLVLDALVSAGPHVYRMHWLLSDLPYEWEPAEGRLTLDTPTGPYYLQALAQPPLATYSLVRADPDSPRGWQSLYYMHKEPALSIDATVQAERVLFITLFSPWPAQLSVRSDQILIAAPDWHGTIRLRKIDDASKPIANAVELDGRKVIDFG